MWAEMGPCDRHELNPYVAFLSLSAVRADWLDAERTFFSAEQDRVVVEALGQGLRGAAQEPGAEVAELRHLALERGSPRCARASTPDGRSESQYQPRCLSPFTFPTKRAA